LGLTIARDLVRLMGGDLAVESEIGRGSKFTFTIPLEADDLTDTLSWRLREVPLNGRTAFMLGPMTGCMRQAADLIVGCGGKVETRLESVDLYSSGSLVIVSPLADDSLLQFLPGRVGPTTRVVCVIQTILPPGRMKAYLKFGVTDFVMAPLKPLEFLPFIAQASSAKEDVPVEAAPVVKPLATKRKKVLIVDDAPENRDLMQLYLSKQDLDLVFAVDGLQALQKYKADQFDLVLTDIQMPVMDGIEELIAIREYEKDNHLREIPIVAITADSRPEARVNLAQLGFKGILIKPLRKADLLTWISREFDPPPPEASLEAHMSFADR
jgi:CheY-like chemotaxis protein